MAITVKCPKCGKKGSLPDGSTGRKARCGKCQTVFVVGAPSLTPPRSIAGSAELPNLDDPSIASTMNALAVEVRIVRPGTHEFRRTERTVALAEHIGDLHRKYPASPELHYAYAAALQLNLLGEQADKTLRECATAHPGFWIANLTARRNSLFAWNPFLTPEFAPSVGGLVHDAISSVLTKTLLLVTRRGPLPRAVVFHRDGADEFEVAALRDCKIDFITLVSPVKDPQVVAINACIWDNPSNPYRTEALACPFLPWPEQRRFAYELFARQDQFDFVIVDRSGRLKYHRVMTPSGRMKAAHGQLVRMFDADGGREIPESECVQALRRHTSLVDASTLEY